MGTSVGFWDSLFGEKVTLELPSSSGGVKKVKVTKKWMERMQREGNIKSASTPTVKVNILDPMGGISFEEFDDPTNFLDALGESGSEHQVEYWTIGERVPQEQYDKFVEPNTKELYALTNYENGKPSTYLIQKGQWEKAREAMRNV